MSSASSSQFDKKPRQNSAFLRLMSVHWWMARLYAVMFISGWASGHLSISTYQSILYDVHTSVGGLTVAMLSWRILVLLQVWQRKYTRRLPKISSNWLKTFILHTVLYGFMWAVPVSGFFLANSYQAENLRFFGITLPDLFPTNSAILGVTKNLHFWFAYIFLAFIVLHLVAQWKVIRAHWRQIQKWASSKLSE